MTASRERERRRGTKRSIMQGQHYFLSILLAPSEFYEVAKIFVLLWLLPFSNCVSLMNARGKFHTFFTNSHFPQLKR